VHYPTKFQPSRAQMFRSSSRAYAGVGDKDQDYLVTKDGEVYYWRNSMFGFGSDKIVYLYYSALTGKEPEKDWFQTPVEGDGAKTVLSKVVASWNDYETAKQYAKSLVSSARTSAQKRLESGSPVDATAVLLEMQQDLKGPADPGKSGKLSPLAVGGIVAGSAVGIMGLLYVISRKK